MAGFICRLIFTHNFMHRDALLGSVLTSLTWLASHLNDVLGYIVGFLSIVLLLFRIRREWKNWNKPPKDDDFE
jgi:hypothetical protein